ncbi:MAG: BNR-4 repeat-containing protein [bacterium]
MIRCSGLVLVVAVLAAGCRGPALRDQTPIVLQPQEHEEALFGWQPRFVRNVPSFDHANRPYIRSRTADLDATGFVHVLDDGRWVERGFLDAVKAKYPTFAGTCKGGGWWPSRIVFDADDHAYTLVRIRLEDKSQRNLLLRSSDRCRTWQVHDLPDGTFSIEHWTGHNEIPGPPPIAILTKLKDHPARWASVMRLSVLFPQKTADGIVLGKPVVVSERCVGMSQHSGGASFAATRDGKTHLVWADVNYVPGEKPRPGTVMSIHRGRRTTITRTDRDARGCPTFLATYDHGTGRLGVPVRLGYAPPPNDVHNTPGVCLDGEGHLHAVTGAHGAPFYYLRSRQPNDAYGGWEAPQPTVSAAGGSEARQTYLAMVIDLEDTVHIVFRQWRKDEAHHEGKQYAALSYQRKRKGYRWEEPRPLVVAPVPGYSIFYHKLALDRRGRLFLSYSHWSTSEPYKSLPGRYHYPAVLCSRDGGSTWHLATTADFR